MLMRGIPNIYVQEYGPRGVNDNTAIDGSIVTPGDYINSVRSIAYKTKKFWKNKEDSELRRDELWMGPQTERVGRHLFASGLKMLIGLTEEGLSDYNAIGLKKVFFSYCNASSIITEERNFGVLAKSS